MRMSLFMDVRYHLQLDLMVRPTYGLADDE